MERCTESLEHVTISSSCLIVKCTVKDGRYLLIDQAVIFNQRLSIFDSFVDIGDHPVPALLQCGLGFLSRLRVVGNTEKIAVITMGLRIIGSAIRGIIWRADRAPGSCTTGQSFQGLVLEAGVGIGTSWEVAAKGVAGDPLMLGILAQQIDRAEGKRPLGGNPD